MITTILLLYGIYMDLLEIITATEIQVVVLLRNVQLTKSPPQAIEGKSFALGLHVVNVEVQTQVIIDKIRVNVYVPIRQRQHNHHALKTKHDLACSAYARELGLSPLRGFPAR